MLSNETLRRELRRIREVHQKQGYDLQASRKMAQEQYRQVQELKKQIMEAHQGLDQLEIPRHFRDERLDLPDRIKVHLDPAYMPDLKPCCADERRYQRGPCTNCGDPSLC